MVASEQPEPAGTSPTLPQRARDGGSSSGLPLCLGVSIQPIHPWEVRASQCHHSRDVSQGLCQEQRSRG